MDVSDVKRILKGILAKSELNSGFDDIYQQYKKAKGRCKEILAEKLWNYMRINYYIPEYFKSDDDYEIAELLVSFAVKHKDTLALKYFFVLLHHRFMLSDILEKAHTSSMLIFEYLFHIDLMKSILDDFITNGLNDKIYTDYFDNDDNDFEVLLFELIRAILPVIQWSMNNYPMIVPKEIDKETLTEFQEVANSLKDKKPAIPKFSAVCRYLYESIHFSPEM